MGNIVSNDCSNSLVFRIKNYSHGSSKSFYTREVIPTGGNTS